MQLVFPVGVNENAKIELFSKLIVGGYFAVDDYDGFGQNRFFAIDFSGLIAVDGFFDAFVFFEISKVLNDPIHVVG